jgi:hypothetical protein
MVKDCPHPPVKSVRVGGEVENKDVNSSYLHPNWGKGGVFKSVQAPYSSNTAQNTDWENNVKSLAHSAKFPLVKAAPVLSEEIGLGLAPTLSLRGVYYTTRSKKLRAKTLSWVELPTLLSPEYTSSENKDLRSSGRVEDIFDTARHLTPTSRKNAKLNPLVTPVSCCLMTYCRSHLSWGRVGKMSKVGWLLLTSYPHLSPNRCFLKTLIYLLLQSLQKGLMNLSQKIGLKKSYGSCEKLWKNLGCQNEDT